MHNTIMSEIFQIPKVDRNRFQVTTVGEEENRFYWLSRSVEERLEHMELLRRINYGDQAAGRLQRVLEVVEQI